jgi:hypothetical protein
MQMPRFEPVAFDGPTGTLEALRLLPADGAPRGLALIAHPNPTQGGSNTNKVVHTLAKTAARCGYVAYCPNLRGVGQSAGVHDHGRGEVDDMAAVLAQAQALHGSLPVLLGGFSFGCFVQAQLAARLETQPRLVLVGPACGKFPLPEVPADTLVIHGETDEVIPLAAVLDWARPQALPVTVCPGVGHFFHGRLTQLAELVHRALAT